MLLCSIRESMHGWRNPIENKLLTRSHLHWRELTFHGLVRQFPR